MRLLPDGSLPCGLKNLLDTHDVVTVQEKGWVGTTNGKLVQLAESEFDVFVTADQYLQYQQNLAGFDLAVVILAAINNTRFRLRAINPVGSFRTSRISAW